MSTLINVRYTNAFFDTPLFETLDPVIRRICFFVSPIHVSPPDSDVSQFSNSHFRQLTRSNRSIVNSSFL